MVTMIIIQIHHNTSTKRKLSVVPNIKRVLFQSKLNVTYCFKTSLIQWSLVGSTVPLRSSSQYTVLQAPFTLNSPLLTPPSFPAVTYPAHVLCLYTSSCYIITNCCKITAKISFTFIPHPLLLPTSQSSCQSSWISFCLFLLPFLSFHILLCLQQDHTRQFLQRCFN